MQKYAQLTEHKRYQIYILKKAEHTQAYIAKMVGVSASTLTKEFMTISLKIDDGVAPCIEA